jgi:hypothetical protein
MALGAQRSEVLGLILRESFKIAVIGVIIGIPCRLQDLHKPFTKLSFRQQVLLVGPRH